MDHRAKENSIPRKIISSGNSSSSTFHFTPGMHWSIKQIVFKSNVGKRKPNLCGKKAITQDMDWTFQFVVART